MRGTPVRYSLLDIFAAPVAIAVLSILGLVVALLGDGVLDTVSWVGLAAPLLVICWALRFRRT